MEKFYLTQKYLKTFKFSDKYEEQKQVWENVFDNKKVCKKIYNLLQSGSNLQPLKSYEDLEIIVEEKLKQLVNIIPNFIENIEEIIYNYDYKGKDYLLKLNKIFLSFLKNNDKELIKDELFFEYISNKKEYYKKQKNEEFNPDNDKFISNLNIKDIFTSFMYEFWFNEYKIWTYWITFKWILQSIFRRENWINWSKKDVENFLNKDNEELFLSIFNTSLREEFLNYIGKISEHFISNNFSDYELQKLLYNPEKNNEEFLDINEYVQSNNFNIGHLYWPIFYEEKFIENKRMTLKTFKVLFDKIYKEYSKEKYDSYLDTFFSFSNKLDKNIIPYLTKKEYDSFFNFNYTDEYKLKLKEFILANMIYSIDIDTYKEDLDFINSNFYNINNESKKELINFITNYPNEFEFYLLNIIEEQWWINYYLSKNKYLINTIKIWDKIIDYSNLNNGISEKLFIDWNMLKVYCELLIKDNFDEFIINSDLIEIIPSTEKEWKNDSSEKEFNRIENIASSVYKDLYNNKQVSCEYRILNNDLKDSKWVVSLSFFHTIFNNILQLNKSDFDYFYNFVKNNYNQAFELQILNFISLLPGEVRWDVLSKDIIKLGANNIDVKKEDLFNLFLAENSDLIGWFYNKDYAENYNISILTFIRLIKYFKNSWEFLKYFQEQHKIDSNINLIEYKIIENKNKNIIKQGKNLEELDPRKNMFVKYFEKHIRNKELLEQIKNQNISIFYDFKIENLQYLKNNSSDEDFIYFIEFFINNKKDKLNKLIWMLNKDKNIDNFIYIKKICKEEWFIFENILHKIMILSGNYFESKIDINNFLYVYKILSEIKEIEVDNIYEYILKYLYSDDKLNNFIFLFKELINIHFIWYLDIEKTYSSIYNYNINDFINIFSKISENILISKEKTDLFIELYKILDLKDNNLCNTLFKKFAMIKGDSIQIINKDFIEECRKIENSDNLDELVDKYIDLKIKEKEKLLSKIKSFWIKSDYWTNIEDIRNIILDKNNEIISWEILTGSDRWNSEEWNWKNYWYSFKKYSDWKYKIINLLNYDDFFDIIFTKKEPNTNIPIYWKVLLYKNIKDGDSENFENSKDLWVNFSINENWDYEITEKFLNKIEEIENDIKNGKKDIISIKKI